VAVVVDSISTSTDKTSGQHACKVQKACDTLFCPTSKLVMNAHAPVLKWLVSLRAPTREGDWEALYRQELPRIYNFFRYRMGNDALAEDLTSITFEKAWRSRYQHRHDLAAFSTWLFAIAKNVAIDHFRRRRVEVPIEELSESPAPGDLEAEISRRSQFRRLSQLMDELPDRERELLALKYGSGLTNREIASVTGMSESNIGTILYRTLGRLRTLWDEGESQHG
jgi:RNA polymerase sigma-70 factor (ECF subfamily)